MSNISSESDCLSYQCFTLFSRFLEFSEDDIEIITDMSRVNHLMWRTVTFALSEKELKCFNSKTVPVYVMVAKWFQLLQISATAADTFVSVSKIYTFRKYIKLQFSSGD